MSYYTPQPYSVVPAAAPVQPYASAPGYDPNAYAAPPAQVQPYGGQAAPAYVAPPQAQYPPYNANRDELRTIFVTGFPPDLRDREMTNMCRFMPGYEAASIKSGHGAQQGFVLFTYGSQAHQALSLLNGLDFGDGCHLRAEMARKNMYVREDRPSKMYRSEAPPPQGPGGSPYAPVDRNSDNPPCDTLFVGNLPPHVSEEEVEGFFRNTMGNRFTACKVNRNASGRVSAFVQFADIEAAKEAHSTMQGKELPGSDRGPMRIQFSKNALGKRRREEAERAAAAANAYAAQDPGYNQVDQHLQQLQNVANAGPPGAPGGPQ
eukprot:jgi/Ulvmu1/1503/UM011_0233.1